MAIKSAYRQKAAPEIDYSAPENTLESNVENTHSSENTDWIPDYSEPDNSISSPADIPPQPVEAPPTEGAEPNSLAAQIAALHRAEQLHQQQPPPRPLTVEDRRAALLDQWRDQGMTDAEERELISRPVMIDFPAVTALAAREAAAAGLEKGSEQFFAFTRQRFDAHMNRQQPQYEPEPEYTPQPMPQMPAMPEPMEEQPTMTPTPAFFAPRAPREPAARSRSHIVSAPVSRSTPSTDGSYRHDDSGGRVTLTALEREIAAASHISEAEYARGKARLAKEKREGLRQV